MAFHNLLVDVKCLLHGFQFSTMLQQSVIEALLNDISADIDTIEQVYLVATLHIIARPHNVTCDERVVVTHHLQSKALVTSQFIQAAQQITKL